MDDPPRLGPRRRLRLVPPVDDRDGATIAPSDGDLTVPEVAASGLTTARQADLPIERIRGVRERIHMLADGESFVMSRGRVSTTVDSPGHAKHHLALHDSESGLLFAGDAVGVRPPDVGVLRPATPPPDFDLDQAINSMLLFADRKPAGIALAHYGLVPDADADPDPAARVGLRPCQASTPTPRA